MSYFSQRLGTTLFQYFTDFKITSDNSIWPLSTPEKISGIISDGASQTHPIYLTGLKDSFYFRVVFMKS